MFTSGISLYQNVYIHEILAMSIKNGVNATLSVQSKIFPKLKALILQMRYQNVLKSLL